MAFAAEIRTAHGFAHAAGEPVLRHQPGNSGMCPHAPGPCCPHCRRWIVGSTRVARALSVIANWCVPPARREHGCPAPRARLFPRIRVRSRQSPFRSKRWDGFDLMLVGIFIPHMRGFKMNACGNAKSAAGAPWLRVCVRECRRSQPSGNSSFTVRVACTHAAHQLRNAMRMRRRLRVIRISSRGPCISPDIVRILLRVS